MVSIWRAETRQGHGPFSNGGVECYNAFKRGRHNPCSMPCHGTSLSDLDIFGIYHFAARTKAELRRWFPCHEGRKAMAPCHFYRLDLRPGAEVIPATAQCLFKREDIARRVKLDPVTLNPVNPAGKLDIWEAAKVCLIKSQTATRAKPRKRSKV